MAYKELKLFPQVISQLARHLHRNIKPPMILNEVLTKTGFLKLGDLPTLPTTEYKSDYRPQQ